VRATFGCQTVDAETAVRVLHGARIDADPDVLGAGPASPVGPASAVGVLDPDGRVLSLGEVRDGVVVPFVVFS
jgi:hypothetical protein